MFSSVTPIFTPILKQTSVLRVEIQDAERKESQQTVKCEVYSSKLKLNQLSIKLNGVYDPYFLTFDALSCFVIGLRFMVHYIIQNSTRFEIVGGGLDVTSLTREADSDNIASKTGS